MPPKGCAAEQMSWDITTKEKCEIALDKENLSWEEPLLDESGEFLDTEMPDTAVEPPNMEKDVNSPVNDDDDPPVSEPPVAENEDHSEDETQVEEPDPVTEESREIERDQLRRRLTSKQSELKATPEYRAFTRAFSCKGGRNGIEVEEGTYQRV